MNVTTSLTLLIMLQIENRSFAIRQADATGEEGTFIFALREPTNRRDDNFYEELGCPEIGSGRLETRIDKWMETVNKYFPV